ncbi:hypothetical protein OS493_031595 [Desmophyllum pertusum]|uniref:TRAF-type domain-containing protein n=1 Tax=Desmophyllum pertusum TaxID=174260 RepID=A0A9W9YJM8_9CNID|nr:hypothetical protein OS493_031595 [Desmophyllum pertusum]
MILNTQSIQQALEREIEAIKRKLQELPNTAGVGIDRELQPGASRFNRGLKLPSLLTPTAPPLPRPAGLLERRRIISGPEQLPSTMDDGNSIMNEQRWQEGSGTDPPYPQELSTAAHISNRFIWKFTQFDDCLQKAKDGSRTFYLSDPFQRGSYGKRKCPIDRRPLDERSAKDIYPDVAIERNDFGFCRVKCPNERNDCKWTGELRSVQAHESNCNFVGVKCTNKDCEATPLRKDLDSHVTNECPKRRVECHYCRTSFVWYKRQDHFDVCEKYPMTCLQRCGENKIPREKMNDHIEQSCPHTKVECTFALIGCKEKVQRRTISDHVKRSTESHLKLACERLQELQVSSALSVANIKEMQAEMVTTMKKSKELSDAILKRRGQGLQDLRDKIAETNKKLEELQSKENANDKLSALQTEVVIIKKQLKELSGNVPNDEKLSEFHDAINKLQTLMPRINSQLQDLRSEVAWTNNETNKKLKNSKKQLLDWRNKTPILM